MSGYYCHINPLTVRLVTTEAETISLSQAHAFSFLHCLCITTMTPSPLQNVFCENSSLSFHRNKFITKLPQTGFFWSVFMVMQLMVSPFFKKMPRRRRMSTSCCVWMAAVSPWTTTKPVTGPGCLLTPLWLEMIARLMTSGAFSQKHRYHQALLSSPYHPLFCPLALLALSRFPSTLVWSFADFFSLMAGKIWCGHKQHLPALWATWQEGPRPQRLAFQRLCYTAEAYPSSDGFPALPWL